jgi:hypothetical protein
MDGSILVAFDMMVAQVDVQKSDRVEDLHLEVNVRTKKVTRER